MHYQPPTQSPTIGDNFSLFIFFFSLSPSLASLFPPFVSPLSCFRLSSLLLIFNFFSDPSSASHPFAFPSSDSYATKLVCTSCDQIMTNSGHADLSKGKSRWDTEKGEEERGKRDERKGEEKKEASDRD